MTTPSATDAARHAGVANVRHMALLERVERRLGEARAGRRRAGEGRKSCSPTLQDAFAALDEISGEALLGGCAAGNFRRFCIGKYFFLH